MRHFEKLGFEFADIDDWPFDQRRDFIEQAVGLVDLGAQRLCLGGQMRADRAAAFGVVGNDLALAT